MSRVEIDRQNEAFWDELCGSRLASSLGITDDSPQSLALFDKWYFDLYPYLFDHVPFESIVGKRVLEIGLGYGTVAQRLITAGADYHGLDIATGPVRMVSKRIQHLGQRGAVCRGSILAPPYPTASFDWVVAIGSLHHTGDLRAAIGKVHDLLKRGGRALIMVYSATSYRQWRRMPYATLRRLHASPGLYERRAESAVEMRGLYDSNVAGEAAPHTEFVTKAELRHLCRAFHTCRIVAENIDVEGPFRFFTRRTACRVFGSLLGLDLYCHLHKQPH